jgi:hypothetical protein
MDWMMDTIPLDVPVSATGHINVTPVFDEHNYMQPLESLTFDHNVNDFFSGLSFMFSKQRDALKPDAL